ncbi:MAG: tRNA-uridine aminocarboxypropyltransferase, partial [Bdellovibrionota bacterium]
AEYLRKRSASPSYGTPDRKRCNVCRRSAVTCLCSQILRFDPKIKFVILTHLREAQNPIATGRLSHQSLENSEFLVGTDFSANEKVNGLIKDPANHCVILYPGSEATNLTLLSPAEQNGLFPCEKSLVVFVIDGTWFTAPKILRLSKNLQALPKICFNPPAPSRFRIRRQPKPYCHSTVEAIHHVIELLGEARGFDLESGTHNSLLKTFDYMVEQQMEFGAREKLICQWSPRGLPPLPKSRLKP